MAICDPETQKRLDKVFLDATRAFSKLEKELVSAVVAYKRLLNQYENSCRISENLIRDCMLRPDNSLNNPDI